MNRVHLSVMQPSERYPHVAHLAHNGRQCIALLRAHEAEAPDFTWNRDMSAFRISARKAKQPSGRYQRRRAAK